ncbi:MAG: hypothetical protein HOP02_00255 [Methylococcaceae bacterium]|nr:hypothetical protein [Methylococcaceae bacterium]
MPYVIQDNAGKIIALNATQQVLQSVWLDDDDPALLQFINHSPIEESARTTLEQSDLELIRVIEDLTDLLIKKQVFTFTELPTFVQQKLGNRQKMRTDMVSLKSLLNDENEAGIF